MAGGSSTAAQRRERALRAEVEVVRLRALSLSFDAIAQAPLPCLEHAHVARTLDGGTLAARILERCDHCEPRLFRDRSAAKKAHDRALAREYGDPARQEERDRLKRHQLSQIDLVLQYALRRYVRGAEGAARYGEVALRALDRRSKLLGLDAPVKLQVTDELDAQIMALAEQLEQEVTGAHDA